MSPCAEDCTTVSDKQIVFGKDSCLASDPRFLWDYTQALLSIDGRIATSGNISTSDQLEGSVLTPKALGLGSLNFTPPSGYGGIVYSGGSIFYYWNNNSNSWQEIDFNHLVLNTQVIEGGPGIIVTGDLTGDIVISLDPAYEVLDIFHNGVFVTTKRALNFQDSVSASWSITSNGDATISAFGTGGGTWVADVNAGGFSINNLSNIDGIPVAYFQTNPWNRNVNANSYSLSGLGSLSTLGSAIIGGNLNVAGVITYQNQPLDAYIKSMDLWTLNADGSIQRASNVHVIGLFDVTTSGPQDYLYVNNPTWSAFGARINGVYKGELGFSATVVELWTATSLILRGLDNGTTAGVAYFPGYVGIQQPVPGHTLDVTGDARITGCIFLGANVLISLCPDINGNLTISGNTNLVGATTANSLLVSGNAQVNGSFLGGAANFNSINTSTLTINGVPITTAGVVSLNGLGGAVAIAPGLNISVSPSGQNITIATNSNVTFGTVSANAINSTTLNASGYYLNGVPITISGYTGVTSGGPVTANRTFNVAYTNNTGRPMMVSITAALYQSATVAMQVNGALVADMWNNATEQNVNTASFWVLPGQTYEAVGAGGPQLTVWCEWW